MSRVFWIVIALTALPASALEPRRGSQLKTTPAPPAVTSPAVTSPSVTTPAIRLIGAPAGNGPAPLPALVATEALQLWGKEAAATVTTPRLLLVGAMTGPITHVQTDAIRLWGNP